MKLSIGDKASYTRTVTETDVVMYGGISGDLNPAHFDEEYARGGMFKGRIAHGMLTASYISAVLGMKLPGPGSIYLSQKLRFTKPVRFGDTITAMAEVIHLDVERRQATLSTTCINQNDETVLKGEATVIPPK